MNVTSSILHTENVIKNKESVENKNKKKRTGFELEIQMNQDRMKRVFDKERFRSNDNEPFGSPIEYDITKVQLPEPNPFLDNADSTYQTH